MAIVNLILTAFQQNKAKGIHLNVIPLASLN